jgi:hypothetical protein
LLELFEFPPITSAKGMVYVYINGIGRKPSGEDLRVATPDGLRRSAFREGFAVRTRGSGAVDLKAVGRKPSGEGFARCDTGRLAPFRF